MNITPKGSTAQSSPVPTSNNTSARERAIARLSTPPQQAQATPVANPNQISAEEMGAIRQPQQVQDSGQIDTAEETLDASEQVVEETPQESEAEKETLSKQFAALQRQEKQLRMRAQKQSQELKAREAALQAREEALKAKEQEYSTGYVPKARLQSSPLEVLSELGLSYEKLTEFEINRQTIPPQLQAHIQKLEAKLAAIEESNTNSAKAQTEAQQQQYQAAVNQIRTDVKQLVSKDPNFETIKVTGSVNDVVDLIEQTFNQEGVLLSVEEACQQVEDYLVEEAEKLTRIEKIKRRIMPDQAQAGKNATEQRPATQQQKQPMKTLTNAMGSTRQMSARERAMLAFKGELK